MALEPQDVANAELDIDTVGAFVNGSPSDDVTNRAGATFPSLQKIIASSSASGRRVFATLAERDEWEGRPPGAQAYVSDTDLSYRWTGTTGGWVTFEDPTIAAADEATAARDGAEAAAADANEALVAFLSASAGTQTFLTKADALASSVADRSFVVVAVDETQAEQRTLYQKTGAVLSFVRTLEERTVTPLAEEIIARQGNALGAAGGLYGYMLDSLSFGAGGSNYREYLSRLMRAALGDGGPGWMGFSNGVAVDQGVSPWGKGASVNYVGLTDGLYGQYSIDGYGLYTANGDGGSTCYFHWGVASRWTAARVFFLKGPGMGSFKWKFATESDALARPVNCADSVFGLGYVDIEYAGTTKPTLVFNAITGNTCVFGADFKLNDTGYRPALLAQGGRRLQDVAAQNAAFRQAWFAALPFRRIILDGGMNDRTNRTASQHEADLTAIVTAIQAGSPDSEILMVQSLEPSNAATSHFQSYTARKIAVAKAKGLSYLDLRRYFGDYATAAANDLMADGLHPNDKANRLRAQIYAQALGLPTGLNDPGLTPWGGGGGGGGQVLNGSLTRKENRDIVSGHRAVLWRIGLINGFPQVVFDISICGNRLGTSATTVKRAIIALTNGSTVNQAALPRPTSIPTVTTAYQVGAGGADPGTMYDFAIDVTIIGNQAEIAITPVTYDGVFSASADFQFVYHSPSAAGQTVYEN